MENEEFESQEHQETGTNPELSEHEKNMLVLSKQETNAPMSQNQLKEWSENQRVVKPKRSILGGSNIVVYSK